MLARLRQGSLSISELAAPVPMSFAGVAKHVDVLERAGLVRKVRSPEDGRVLRLELEDATLREAAEWIAYHRAFWDDKLEQLKAFMEAEETDAAVHRKNRKKNQS